ncbi:MAG: redoxin domain-containing protein [Nitrospirae bacterium]|nr:redoxin domain-containing protein [Nitrospirota bacterium]
MVLLAGCGGMMDDLAPSGSDKRPAVMPGTTGPLVGQNAPDFTLPDTLGTSVTLSSVITTTGVQGAVLYFTMWCPICDAHMSNMRNTVLPAYPNVPFFLVDYVSGSVAGAQNAELSNGYAGSGFTVLADTQQTVLGLYQATMGTTVVIDRTGVIRMNEDYKDGTRLKAALAALP